MPERSFFDRADSCTNFDAEFEFEKEFSKEPSDVPAENAISPDPREVPSPPADRPVISRWAWWDH